MSSGSTKNRQVEEMPLDVPFVIAWNATLDLLHMFSFRDSLHWLPLHHWLSMFRKQAKFLREKRWWRLLQKTIWHEICKSTRVVNIVSQSIALWNSVVGSGGSDWVVTVRVQQLRKTSEAKCNHRVHRNFHWNSSCCYDKLVSWHFRPQWFQTWVVWLFEVGLETIYFP